MSATQAPQHKVQHGNLEVFYWEGATKAEADRLGAHLVKSWGAAAHRQSVQLKRTAGGYQFRMVIKEEFQNNEKVMQELAFVGARISRDVLDGAAVEVHACDMLFRTLKAIPPRADIRYGVVEGKAEVFFSADVEKGEAQRFAKHVGREVTEPISFKLARRGTVVEVHMAIPQERLKDPSVIISLRQTRNDIAVNVFQGATVEMHLCNELLEVVQVLKQ